MTKSVLGNHKMTYIMLYRDQAQLELIQTISVGI